MDEHCYNHIQVVCTQHCQILSAGYYNSREQLGYYVMSYFGHQTLLSVILDLGKMVTNILSCPNVHATETIG